MKRRLAYLAATAVGLIVTASALGGTGITATPAATKTFDGGSTQAKFVRSASGIINETNRVGLHGTAQNPWSPYDVVIQFRPLTNPTGGVVPNPACEGPTVIAPFTFSTTEASIAGTLTGGYFLPEVQYNVCVYYAHPFVLTLLGNGSTDLTVQAGDHVVYTGNYSNGGVPVAGSPIGLDVFTGTGCVPANSLYPNISAGSTDVNGNYSFDGGPAPIGTYSVKAHSPSPLGTTTSNCVDIVVQGQVASGTVDSTSLTGTTASLPLAGTYRIDVSGTWTNDGFGWVDAEFTDNQSGGSQDGWPGLTADFGDLEVNNAFVDWGAFDAGHAYSLTGSYSGSVNLSIFDGDGAAGPLAKNPAWYGDNTGTLSYTITYLGP